MYNTKEVNFVIDSRPDDLSKANQLPYLDVIEENMSFVGFESIFLKCTNNKQGLQNVGELVTTILSVILVTF